MLLLTMMLSLSAILSVPVTEGDGDVLADNPVSDAVIVMAGSVRQGAFG